MASNIWEQRAVSGVATNTVALAEMAKDVKSFGAKGDGVTDDTAAFAAAAAAIPATGGRIYVPAGTYIVETPVLVPSYCTIFGAGKRVSIIKSKVMDYSGRQKGSVLMNKNYVSHTNDVIVDYNIVVHDLTLDGNRDNITHEATEQEGIDLLGVENFLIENVEVKNIIADGIDINGCKYGEVCYCDIIDCTWDGFHAGGAVDASYQMRVHHNYVARCAQGRVGFDDMYGGINNDTDNGSIESNVIEGCWRGICVSASGSKILIANNIIYDTETGYDIYCLGSYSRIVGNFCMAKSAATGNIYCAGIGQGVVINGNTCTHGKAGIKVENTKPVIISSNLVRGACYVNGINVAGTSHIIEGNVLEYKPSATARGSIEIASTAPNTTVSNNVIYGDEAGRAIMSKAAGVIVESNQVYGGSAVDIEIQSTDNIISANRCGTATTEALLLTATSATCLVIGNNFNGSAAGWSNLGTDNVAGTNIPALT
jgi:parallel beta-helix repeat protein